MHSRRWAARERLLRLAYWPLARGLGPSNIAVHDPTRSAILAGCYRDPQIALVSVDASCRLGLEVESSCYMTLELALSQVRMYRVSMLQSF